jgi:hypothetical protein
LIKAIATNGDKMKSAKFRLLFSISGLALLFLPITDVSAQSKEDYYYY